MNQTATILFIVLLLTALSAASTTTQPSKSEQTKAEWNRVVCIAIHVIQMVAAGIAALVIMVAGLKYLTSEEINSRDESKKTIVRALSILLALAVVAQVVNYVVSGSSIQAYDINSCNDLFPGTTQPVVPTSVPTTGPTTTTLVNGTTSSSTSSSSTTSSSTTTTTLAESCTDPGDPHSIPNKNSCEKASSVNQCNTDYYPAGGNGVTDLDDYLGRGFSKCCCDNGYPKCC
jgi:hypothetical protein